MRELNPLEELYLARDTDCTVGHFGRLLLFDTPGAKEVSLDAIRAHLAERLPHILPLRWTLASDPARTGRHRLVEAGAPDLARHVHEAAVAPPGGTREIARLVAHLNARLLDRAHPLWELHVLRGTPAGRLAVFLKVHHAIVDGVAARDVWRLLFGPAGDVTSPSDPPAERGIGGAEAESTAVPEPEPVPDAPWTRFNNPLCGERDVAFASLDAEPLDAARRAAGATLTEGLLATTAGALRSWLGERDELPGEPLVTSLPALIRSSAESAFRVNRLWTLTLQLPTDEPDPMRRLRAARDMLHAAKLRVSHGPRSSPYLDWPGPPLNLSLSSISPPPAPLALCGAPLASSHSFGMLGAAGLNITYTPRPGRVDFGVHVDRRQGDGGWSIVAALETSMDELELALA